LSRGQLAYLSELDHRNHVALGLLDGENPAAVGRWVRFDDVPDAADVALTVIDDYQRRGIGRLLLKLLALAARHRGVRWLHFDVLAENRGMLRVLDGFDAVRTETGPIIHAVLDADTVGHPAGVTGDLGHVLDRAASRAS
jgi:GNAT superfamily N-acetyltransferase